MDAIEKRLRQEISDLHRFLMNYGFTKKPTGTDDYVDICKFCGGEGYGKLGLRHKKSCELGKLLK